MNELFELLKQLNIPVAYHHFVEATIPPYIAYYRLETNNFYADNKVYQKIDTYRIELYTLQKDVTLESQLEQLLETMELPYEIIAESYIESEKVYQVIYEVNI